MHERETAVVPLSDSEQLLSVDFDWYVGTLLCMHHFHIRKRVKSPILNCLHLLLTFDFFRHTLSGWRPVILAEGGVVVG